MCESCCSCSCSRRCLTGGGAQIRPHPAVAMALILTVDNDGVEQSQVAVQWVAVTLPDVVTGFFRI